VKRNCKRNEEKKVGRGEKNLLKKRTERWGWPFVISGSVNVYHFGGGHVLGRVIARDKRKRALVSKK